MMTKSIREGLTGEELDQFETLLLERRALLLGDMRSLEDGEARDSSELSHLSTHQADQGTDRAASDLSLGYLESASGEIHDIDEALARIADGSYGLCENCDQPMAKARLEAIPYARLCLPCKQSDEA